MVTRAMNDEKGRSLTLHRYLGSRLLPLAVLVASAVSLGAPAAMLDLRLRELRRQAESIGKTVAGLISREAQERPVLWRYDSLKLVEHVSAHDDHDNVRRIEVTDPEGHPLGFGVGTDMTRLVHADVLWGSSPITINGELVGDVWVGVSASTARRDAIRLLIPFSLLGLILAALIYRIPLRAAVQAEERINALVTELDRSRRALADRGEDLEREVLARASELTRAYAELKRKEARLRDLSSRAVVLEEDERRAIARELHDSAGQALTAIRIHLQLIGEQVKDSEKMHDLVEKTLAMTDETVEEIRRAVRMLGPAILDEIGLGPALERYCDDFSERTRAEVDHRIDLDGAELSAAVESACYRITQEALNNVAKHAKATRVDVQIALHEGSLIIEIEDNGRGFSPDERGDGRGLTGMRERAELLGGSLAVRSTPGKGTKLRAELSIQ
ncbi:MAG: sensor histidine kinase [Byssovorax sp.]